MNVVLTNKALPAGSIFFQYRWFDSFISAQEMAKSYLCQIALLSWKKYQSKSWSISCIFISLVVYGCIDVYNVYTQTQRGRVSPQTFSALATVRTDNVSRIRYKYEIILWWNYINHESSWYTMVYHSMVNYVLQQFTMVFITSYKLYIIIYRVTGYRRLLFQ